MVGCGKAANSSISRVARMRSLRSSGLTSLAASLRSMPALKYRLPVPVRTTTCTRRSKATERHNEASSSRIVWFRAWAASGRLSHTVSSPSSRRVRVASPSAPTIRSDTLPRAQDRSVGGVFVDSPTGFSAKTSGGNEIAKTNGRPKSVTQRPRQ